MTKPFDRKDNEFVAWYPLGLTPEEAGNVWSPRAAGYYVHIPFCTAICDYCGFAVEKLKGASVRRYLDALKSEISRYADLGRISQHKFICGHFGGGTPTAIAADDLLEIKKLIDESFLVEEGAEVTLEANPISLTTDKAQAYREGGVNRISIGVQSFDDTLLATIGRPHRGRDVAEALRVIHDAHFDNFSLDLIYGIPGQTRDQLLRDLAHAAATGCTHISCFRLEIIPMTALKLREVAFQLPSRLSDDELNEMDDLVIDTLSGHGYVPYGAFNFARPGYESVHNKVAFMAPQSDYVGFGNSAYSFLNDHIFCNFADLPSYERAALSGEDPIALASRVDATERMSRYFVLGLKFHRVSRSRFQATFGCAPEAMFAGVLDELATAGLLSLEKDEYQLTRDGRRYVNNVIKRFFIGKSVDRNQYQQFVSNLSPNQILHFAEMRDRAIAKQP